MVDFSKYGVQPAPAPTVPTAVPASSPSPAKTNIPPAVSAPVPEAPVVSKFAKYGVPSAPVTPASVPEAKPTVPGTLMGPLKESVGGLKTLYGGGDQGIAKKLVNDVSEGAKDYAGPPGIKQLLGPTKAGFRAAGDIAGTVFAPVAALIGATGLPKVFDKVGEAIANKKGGLIDKVTDIPAVQKYVISHPNTGEDFGRALNLLFAEQEKGKIEPSTAIERTIPQVKAAVEKGKTFLPSEAKRTAKIIEKRVTELNNIDKGYAQMRKASGFSKDEGVASRRRVASTDVLENAVDENGVIRTKGKGGPIDQYKAQTLDGAEGIVRANLEKLGETVPLKTVEKTLVDAVNSSSLEGADLTRALNAVKKEVAAYKLKADENGNIPLTLVHDAKINMTKGINYFTPPESATYRKAIARGLKETVENNSKFNVKEVNAELAKYLDDIAFLERLDGKRVKGGRLGKYFAQISGNIVGGTAGAAIGGPFGSAVGTIVGGELAGKIKGNMMEKSLAGKSGYVSPKNPVLEAAKVSAQENSLGKPNRKYSSTNIPKTIEPKTTIPEIIPKTDGKGNTIPASKSAVEKIINKIKNTPNKEGGFIKIPTLNQGASAAEKGTMRDFMDLVSGEYKPDAKTAAQLKADAQDIATKYKFKSAFGGDKGLSSAFGKYLNRVKFNK